MATLVEHSPYDPPSLPLPFLLLPLPPHPFLPPHLPSFSLFPISPFLLYLSVLFSISHPPLPSPLPLVGVIWLPPAAPLSSSSDHILRFRIHRTLQEQPRRLPTDCILLAVQQVAIAQQS